MSAPTVRRIAASLLSIAAACSPLATYAGGGELSCAVEKRTDAHQCIDPLELRETDGIRWAPLYRGGPNSIRKTSMTAHANCGTQVLHLKDRDGVSFAGGRFYETDMARQLGGILCQTELPKQRQKPKKKN